MVIQGHQQRRGLLNMMHFELNAANEVIAIAKAFPKGADHTRWTSRWDFKSLEDAQRIADSATKLTDTLYIATDAAIVTGKQGVS